MAELFDIYGSIRDYIITMSFEARTLWCVVIILLMAIALLSNAYYETVRGTDMARNKRERKREIEQKLTVGIIGLVEPLVDEGKLTRHEADKYYKKLGHWFDLKELAPWHDSQEAQPSLKDRLLSYGVTKKMFFGGFGDQQYPPIRGGDKKRRFETFMRNGRGK